MGLYDSLMVILPAGLIALSHLKMPKGATLRNRLRRTPWEMEFLGLVRFSRDLQRGKRDQQAATLSREKEVCF